LSYSSSMGFPPIGTEVSALRLRFLNKTLVLIYKNQLLRFSVS